MHSPSSLRAWLDQLALEETLTLSFDYGADWELLVDLLGELPENCLATSYFRVTAKQLNCAGSICKHPNTWSPVHDRQFILRLWFFVLIFEVRSRSRLDHGHWHSKGREPTRRRRPMRGAGQALD